MAKAAKKSPRAKKRPVTQKVEAPAAVAQVKQNRTQTLLVILLIVVSFFTGYLFFRLQSLEQGGAAGQPQVPQQPANVKAVKPDPAKDHWRGSKDAQLVWVEYSDLECPFCKNVHPSLQQMLEEYDGKVAWVYRHYPLSFHPKAQKAAEAVECANELGGQEAFWKMADLIIDRMPDIQLSQIPALGTEAGVDPAELKSCIDSGKHAQKVKDQLAEGTKAGVQATPTGVIFDMKTGEAKTVEGAVPYEQIKAALDEALGGS